MATLSKYETFGRRVVAYILDGGIWSMPMFVLGGVMLAIGMSRVAYTLYELFYVAIGAAYFIGMHKWRGQTLGKMAMKVRVLTLDDKPLSWAQSIRRYWPFLLVQTLTVIVHLIALAKNERITSNVVGAMPGEASWTIALGWIVFFARQIYVTTESAECRAIHDHLAGTRVVIVEEESKKDELKSEMLRGPIPKFLQALAILGLVLGIVGGIYGMLGMVTVITDKVKPWEAALTVALLLASIFVGFVSVKLRKGAIWALISIRVACGLVPSVIVAALLWAVFTNDAMDSGPVTFAIFLILIFAALLSYFFTRPVKDFFYGINSPTNPKNG